MNFVKRAGGGWQYHLNQIEANLLKSILKRFPFAENATAKTSRTGKNPKAAERDKLLNESLAQHRKELKKQAANLICAKQCKDSGKGLLLTLHSEEREILLQILNDVRVECWVALGKPESIELQTPDCSAQEFARFNLLNLAGYFEHHLLCSESGDANISDQSNLGGKDLK